MVSVLLMLRRVHLKKGPTKLLKYLLLFALSTNCFAHHEGPMKILHETIMSYIHLPYNWGGENPETGFDCSGLVIDILQTVGELPNRFDTSAHGLFVRYRKEGISSEVGLGSLVFYGKIEKVTHVGIMLDDFRILEAGAGNSRIKTLADAIKADARIRIRPYTFRKDIVEIIRPKYSRLKRSQQ